MNLFLRRLILYLLPIFIFLLSIEVFIRFLPNDYTFKRDYLNDNSDKLTVLFLGNSHAYYGINPYRIKQNCFNAAYVSQSVNYDFQIIEKYKEKWKKVKYVFIPLDYYTLYNRLEYGTESFRKKNYANYYLFPSSDFFWENLEICNGKISQIFLKVYRAIKVTKKSGLNIISCNSLGWGARTKSKTDIDISGKFAALRQKNNSNNFLKINIEQINKIISVLKSKNVQLVLYTPPACKAYIDGFDSDQFDIIRNIGINFAKRNTNVKYFDFLKDPSFTENDFNDGDHLCIEGAQKFSKKIDSVLNKLVTIKN